MAEYMFIGFTDQGGDYRITLNPSTQCEDDLVGLIRTYLLSIVDEGSLHIYKKYEVQEDITPA
jgi:hypothetical protein